MADGSTNGNPKSNPAASGGNGSSQPQNSNNSHDVLDRLTGQIVSQDEMARRTADRQRQIRETTYMPTDMREELERQEKEKTAAKTPTEKDAPAQTTTEREPAKARQTGRTDIYMPVPIPERKSVKPASAEPPKDGTAKEGTSSAALDALKDREKVAEAGSLNRPDKTAEPASASTSGKGLEGIYMPAAPSPRPRSNEAKGTPDGSQKKDDPTLTTRALQQSALINDPLADALKKLDSVPTSAKRNPGAQQAGVINALKDIMGVPATGLVSQAGGAPGQDQKQNQQDEKDNHSGHKPVSGSTAVTTSVEKPSTGHPGIYTPISHPKKAKGRTDIYMPAEGGEEGGGDDKKQDQTTARKQQTAAIAQSQAQAQAQAAAQAQALRQAQLAELAQRQAEAPEPTPEEDQTDEEEEEDDDEEGKENGKKKSENPAKDKAKKEAGKQAKSKIGGFLKKIGTKLFGFLKVPIGALGGVSAAVVLLIILVIILVIMIFAMLDSTNDVISQENTTGRSAAFFKYFGAAGGEGNNFLQSLGKPTVELDGTPLQNVKLVRVQYGLRLNSKAEINRAFGGGSDSYDVEVSQLDLWTKLTVPEGSSNMSFGITEQSFWSKFRSQMPPNYKVTGGSVKDGITMSFTPSLCDGKTCQYETDYNLTSESRYDPAVPVEAFEAGSGVFRVSFGGSVNLTIKRAGQPDEYTSVPISPSVTVCIDIKNGSTRSCDSPVGDGRSTGNNVGGTGKGSSGGTVDGITCPFDHDASPTGASLVCSNGYSGNHTAIDMQVRSNGGNGAVATEYTVRAPVAGVLRRQLASYESSCGPAVTVTRADGVVFYLGHVTLNGTLTQSLQLGQQPEVTQGEPLGVYFTPAGYVPGDTSGINKRFFPSGQLCWDGPHVHIEYRPDGGIPGSSKIFSVLEKSCSTTGKQIIKRPITGVCQ